MTRIFRALTPDHLAWHNDDADNTTEDYPGPGWDDPGRWESTEDQRWTTADDADRVDPPAHDDFDQRPCDDESEYPGDPAP